MFTKEKILKFIKKMFGIVGYLIILIILIALPLGVERLIKNGIFGLSFPETIFLRDQWFAFWGSYLGALVTVIVFYITIQQNKLETRKMLNDYELDKKYDRLIRNVGEIHNYINLCDISGNAIDRNNIIYSLRLLDKRYYELMNECVSMYESLCQEYVALVMQIFYEYLLECDKIPKNFEKDNIADVAEIYKDTTKKIISIKHKYVNQEASLFDETIKKIEKSRLDQKRGIFNSWK